jgi:hypothetical protein
LNAPLKNNLVHHHCGKEQFKRLAAFCGDASCTAECPRQDAVSSIGLPTALEERTVRSCACDIIYDIIYDMTNDITYAITVLK